MSSMMPIFSTMRFMALRVCCTASPPDSASLAELIAMFSVTRALSVLCWIDAVICSRDALVSSILAACSDAPRTQGLGRRADLLRRQPHAATGIQNIADSAGEALHQTAQRRQHTSELVLLFNLDPYR